MDADPIPEPNDDALRKAARAMAAPVSQWLLDVRAQDLAETEIFSGYVEGLRETGIPLDRATYHPPQLDSRILGRSVQWTGGDMQVFNFEHGIEKTDFALKSPIWQIRQKLKGFIRQRLSGPDASLDYPISDDLAAEGYVEYLMRSVPFSDGRVAGVSIATRREEGFSALDLAVWQDTLSAFGAVAELRNSRETAAGLLDTYLGHGAGERVLKGQIKRGDVEEIFAVIMFCDMRGSTLLSEALEGEVYLNLLNDYFGIIGRAVESRGGEILKFIGDGLLAIFPCQRENVTSCDAADRALWAAEASLLNLGDLSAELEARGHEPLRTGFALHVGDVFYGNVGSEGRLDFTVTGAAVNKVSRLEALTKETGESIILSEEMKLRSSRLSDAFKDLGEFELRGIQGKHRAFAGVPVLL